MQSNVWKIVGSLQETHRRKDKHERARPSSRTVYLVQDDFPTNEEAAQALLHEWSEREQTVTLRAVVPFAIEKDYGGFSETEQMEVIFNVPRPDAERILDYLAEHRHHLQLINAHVPPLPPDLEATVDRRIAAKTWEQAGR